MHRSALRSRTGIACVLALVFLVFLAAPRLPAGVVISEFMPDNEGVLEDEDGDFPDWIELHNPDATPLNLAGWFLTDNPLQPARWTFPSVTMPAGGYLVVFASGKNRTDNPAHLHTSFQLNRGGGYLALVQPDRTTAASAFTYPSVPADVSFGVAEIVSVQSLLASSVPQVLVPATAGDLAPDWNTRGFTLGPGWLPGVVPPAIGFDTNQSPAVASNLAPGGSAQQSTTFSVNAAGLAINGNLADYSQTLATDNAPFWQVTLATEAAIQRVIVRNRTSCCGSRLRDLTVEILSTNVGGMTTNFTSALLNPENAGFSYPNGPAAITNDLVALTGGAVFGQIVRVRRAPDPDLSGSGGQGGADEPAALALGEVEVIGAPAGASQVNLARTGAPAPSAVQSSSLTGYGPELAIDGSLANFSHTAGASDTNATWTLNLGRRALISSVRLHNRESCCGSRLRDITIQILGPDGVTVLYNSPVLNPENAGFTYPNGPADLLLTLAPNPVLGQYVRVHRTPDLDLSGTAGQGNTDEASVLSLAEVFVLGADLNGYRPFIRTDLAARMLNVNASAFVRIPFPVAGPEALSGLQLNVRYDDGFVACLNGVEVARRNAPLAAAWNANATADRDLASGIIPEPLDLTSALPLLVAGTNVLAFQALNVSAGDPDLLLQPELLATSVSRITGVFLSDPTPGAANLTDYYYDQVADTKFSVDRGFFEAPFTLAITSATPGAQIYYSLNADEPGPGKGTLYAGPLLVTNTTVVRARAFKEGWKPTDVDTATYLFLGDVIHQAPNWQQTRLPPPNFPATWGANAVDYGMDPNVVTNYSLAQWKEALTQIPSLSIVTEMRNLFDPVTGIYANALQHGTDWERPGSIEMFEPTNAVPGVFHENCGVRIRGGYSRNLQYVKHSLRVFFRREYGAGKLHYAIFGHAGASEFETFDLRTSQNYSWSLGDTHETLVREEFCEETLGALGQPYRRNRYAHLYLNGQYWGIYEFDERPEASYGQTYFGGSKTNYDVVKCGNHVAGFVTEATDGNMVAWSNLWAQCQAMRTNPANSNYFRILGCLPDGTRNPAWPVLLDVDNLIDYMLEIFYSGDGDATLSSFLGNNEPNNWFGMRDRTNPDVGFRFFNSDAEHTLGAPSSSVDRTGPFGGSNEGNFAFSNPQWMHEELMRNFEYRVRFWDHVQKHFFNGGALMFDAGTNRFLRLAAQITKAVRAYSARWGDAAREPPLGEKDWTAEINWVLTNWFPARAGIVLAQLRADNLFPAVGAPQFGQAGGEVPAGYSLELAQTNGAGAVFYTTDGSDPRLVGGGVAPSAQAYAAALPINTPVVVRARVLIGTNWSPLIQYTFHPPQDFTQLAVTEIMYNPPAVGLADGAEFEFLELKNTGGVALNLSGLQFTAGIAFSFTNGTVLAPGAFFVLVRNPAQFSAKYPGITINGIYSGKLDNSGETLRLTHPLGATVLSLTYDDAAPWPAACDGLGFSLVPRTPGGSDPDRASSWRASTHPGGSPGADDPPNTIAPVLVNEVLTHSETNVDYIELFNPNAAPVDIGGWFLTDDAGAPQKFRIPDRTSIQPLSYVVFDEADFNPQPGAPGSFRLDARGETVYLFSGDAATNLTGYSHGFEFGAAPDGVTFGRYVLSTGEEDFPLQAAATPGGPNAGPSVGPVVISEIHYHPDPGGLEFVELQNLTPTAVRLFDPEHPTNTWRFNGLGYSFPTNVSVPPAGLLLLVASDPALFRFRYNVSAGVAVLGPYPGVLQDSGERLELQRPDVPNSNGVAFIAVDTVRYNDKAPWPAAADGAGPSLQRKNPAAYGNDPANWEAANPSPGVVYAGGPAPRFLSQPQSLSLFAGQTATLTANATGAPPLSLQWRFNGASLPGATSGSLVLSNVQPAQAGSYSVVAFNEAGAVVSAPALLTVKRLPTIPNPPTNQFVRPGANAVFFVGANGNGILHYQWRYQGANLPGATNAFLVVSNAQFVHEGAYAVSVTDSVGSSTSLPAQLFILINPAIIQPPLSQSVAVGAKVTVSVETTGHPFPISYEWRRGSTVVASNVLDSFTSFYSFTAPLTVSTQLYRVIVRNAAYTGVGTNAGFNTITLADNDGDGVPDDWELAYGLSTNDPAHLALDLDGDGMSNGAEYVAGTDPSDLLSYLKIDRVTTGAGAGVVFQAISNRTYTVQYTDDLVARRWIKLADVVAGVTNRVVTVPDPVATTNRVYRLLTPQQP